MADSRGVLFTIGAFIFGGMVSGLECFSRRLSKSSAGATHAFRRWQVRSHLEQFREAKQVRGERCWNLPQPARPDGHVAWRMPWHPTSVPAARYPLSIRFINQDAHRALQLLSRSSRSRTFALSRGRRFFRVGPRSSRRVFAEFRRPYWNDTAALKILRNCRRAIRPNGKLLLIERVLKPANQADDGKLADLNMLVMLGGRERTEAEFRALLHEAGFHLNRVIPTAGPMSIIESLPA